MHSNTQCINNETTWLICSLENDKILHTYLQSIRLLENEFFIIQLSQLYTRFIQLLTQNRNYLQDWFKLFCNHVMSNNDHLNRDTVYYHTLFRQSFQCSNCAWTASEDKHNQQIIIHKINNIMIKFWIKIIILHIMIFKCRLAATIHLTNCRIYTHYL